MRNLRLVPIAMLVTALAVGGFSLRAQGRLYSQDQVSQMVAPIALYPDALVSQVLMAATFPSQVTDADQWVQANPDLTGRALDDALATATWDPSIIALCKFPNVLHRMAQNIAWTTDLGNAFLNQRTDVMNAVQTLRRAAYDSGHLETTPQQRVVVQGPDIVIQPYSQDVIYVPAYDPYVVYGPAWAYPTYYYPAVWAPWPGYSFVNGFAWGVGFAFGNVLFGGCDWYHHDVWVNNTVIVNNGIYHGCPYYRQGYWRGGYGHQPWTRHVERVSRDRGWTGAPYGGRTYGQAHGVRSGPEPSRARGMERAALQTERGPAGRGYERPSVHGPVGYRGSGTVRGGARGPLAGPDRNSARPAVHGPSGYPGNRSDRPASRGPVANPGRGYDRPAAHGPVGYSGAGAPRPTFRGPSGTSERGYGRSPAQGPTGYSGPSHSRPEARAPSGYSRPSYNRQASHAPSSPRGGYGRPSAPRAAPGGYARAGHAGGGGRAPAARGGGQGHHGRR